MGLSLNDSLAGYLLFGLNVDVMYCRWLLLLMGVIEAWRVLPGDGLNSIFSAAYQSE